jgi:hypothetical protein
LGVREGDGGTQRGTILIWGYGSTKRLRTPDVNNKARYYIEKKERKVAKWGTGKKNILELSDCFIKVLIKVLTFFICY